jgi:hypothetical protein
MITSIFHPTKSVVDNTAKIMYDGKSVSRTKYPHGCLKVIPSRLY